MAFDRQVMQSRGQHYPVLNDFVQQAPSDLFKFGEEIERQNGLPYRCVAVSHHVYMNPDGSVFVTYLIVWQRAD